MESNEKIERLSAQEKKVLIALKEFGRNVEVREIEKKANLDHSAVMRSSLSLRELGMIETSEKKWEVVSLTEEGRAYARDGLPERRVLSEASKGENVDIDTISERAGLNPEQTKISLGWIRRKNWVEFERVGEKTVLQVTDTGRAALDSKDPDEQLLEKLNEVPSLGLDELSPELKETVPYLKNRNLINVKEESQRWIVLTPKGEKVLEMGVDTADQVSQLTHEMLVSGEWQKAKLRAYDVTAPGAPIYPGKVHPQQRIIDELREILLEMGFEEIKGPLVESEFWNFDALFQAQNHPAREIHDSLTLSKPSTAKLPPDDLVARVKEAHETGVAESKGWGYKFNTDISKRTVMRSQTTAATVRYLGSKPEPPVKVFCLDRVYRHERIDYKHLAEFYQVEGIVMNPGLNFQNMLGYLKQVLVKMGIPKVRFRPGYFPYTEPSVEADGYFPEKDEWIELLGAGMFRPELLEPLGIKHPVLAWGIGFGRLAMIRLGIEDMRDLNCNDLEWLKKQTLV